ncbi:MAG: dTDP-4-dehydrorhamnose 3,5-epimerase [Myxococcales bacterium]|nr:dTDP-4-dehydrorhamnose 3,5-epimerase [Myxococcales bacterium]
MRTSQTSLPGVLVLETDEHADARGSVREVYRGDRFEPAVTFVQDNVAISVRGALRGLHYRTAPQAKLVMVVEGAIYDVALDVRRDSPTYGRHVAVELSADNRRQLFIPAGFAHGYQALSERAVVVYKLSAPFDPADDRAVRWDDPALAITWPLAQPILSARDATAPLLSEQP